MVYNGHRLDENNNRIEAYKRFTNNGTDGTGFFEGVNPTLETHGTLILKQHTGINFVSVDLVAQTQPMNIVENFVSIYTSADGITFSALPIGLDVFDNGVGELRKAVDGAPQAGWNSYTYMSKEILPEGTNFIKVTINQATNVDAQKAYTPLVDMVRTYETAPYAIGITGDSAVKMNSTLSLQATMEPSKYSFGNVTWTVDAVNTTATGVTVTVDPLDGTKGLFTAESSGIAYVIATYNGVESEAFVIEVADAIPVSDVTFTVPNIVYERRDTIIKVTINPSTADVNSFDWEVVTNNATLTPFVNPEGLAHEYYALIYQFYFI